MLKLWNGKGKAVKKWRSRAWSIDPNKTNLTIVWLRRKSSRSTFPLGYTRSGFYLKSPEGKGKASRGLRLSLSSLPKP